MSEAVRKTALGGFRAVTGDQDPECTHVIFTIDEYNADRHKMKALSNEAYDAKRSAEAMIANEQRQANIRIAAAKKEANEKVAEIQAEMEKLSEELEYQKGLNQNLLRISKERANVERDLRPKREHTGFAVVSSREKELRYKDPRNPRKSLATIAWETVIQSPYVIDFTEEQARKEVRMQLLNGNKENEDWLISSIGIDGIYNGTYDEMLKEKDAALWLQDNALLNWKLKANYQTGYWEVIILHTKPLGVIPMDMRPAGKNKKKTVSGKKVDAQ